MLTVRSESGPYRRPIKALSRLAKNKVCTRTKKLSSSHNSQNRRHLWTLATGSGSQKKGDRLERRQKAPANVSREAGAKEKADNKHYFIKSTERARLISRVILR